MAKNRGGLGRGLGALLGETAPHSVQTPSYSNQTRRKDSEPEDVGQATSLQHEDAAQPMPERSRAEEILEKQKSAAKNQAAESASKGQSTAQLNKNASVEEKSSEKAAQSIEEKAAVDEVELEDHIVIKEVKKHNLLKAPIDKVQPNPDQPRAHFDKEELEELADSISRNGLLQPILVRQKGDSYQIIAGERRWQASRLAGLTEVPINILEADDDKVIELAMIENIQRSDLNPIEEAYGYRRLMERRGLTQSQLAQLVSKGRSTIANSLRLLDLPEDAQQLLFEEKITAGHARAILSIPTIEGRQKLTEKMLDGKMTVREAENMARLISGREEKTATPRPKVPQKYKAVAKNLSKALDTKVRVKVAKGKNKLEIEFTDQDQLERIMSRINAD